MWKETTGVILKKPNKPDYAAFKTYRIIFLLNCLGKVAEKIIVKKLDYFAKTTSLIDCEQIGNKKKKSTINATMSLIHDT